jgi:NitT/TauT family transport system permease protein
MADAARPQRGLRTSGGAKLRVQQVIFLAGWLLLWELASRVWLEPHISGRPSTIVALIATNFTHAPYWNDFLITGTKMVLGLALGVISGVAAALLLGSSGALARMLEPYFVAAYAMPHVALVPLFIVWLGIGLRANTAYVWLETFFFIFFPVYAGVRRPPQHLVRSLRLMGARRSDIVRNVTLPYALTFLISGLSLAVPYSLLAAVGSELIASTDGIGYQILQSLVVNDINLVIASLTFVIALAIVLNAGTAMLRHWSAKWRT